MRSTSGNDTDMGTREVRFIRNPGILERRIDDTVFLVDPEDETVFHLNPVGAGIWRLLADPTSPADAGRILQQAFPEISSDVVISDVSNLIHRLERKGLIRRHGNAAPSSPEADRLL